MARVFHKLSSPGLPGEVAAKQTEGVFRVVFTLKTIVFMLKTRGK